MAKANRNMANNVTTPSQYEADVWKHFGFQVIKGSKDELDKENAVCKLCLATMKYRGNTTNLRTHLARHHAEVLAQKQPPKQIEPNQTTLDNFIPSTSPRAQRITESIVHFICKHLRPYSVVVNAGFRWMLHTIEPRYKIPQRVHMVDTAVPKMYDEVKKVVKMSLNGAQRVALTCDRWTSRATESYVTITSHHISDDWEMVTHVLQMISMHESHTASNIADLLKRAMEEWGIKDRDPAIVTDNPSQHHSAIASHVLKEKQKLLNLEKHKLKTDVVTRWNSAHDMLQLFLEQQPVITAALLSNEVRKNEKDINTLSEADITAAEEIVTAIKPMKIATVAMEEEKTPTLSAVAPVHAQLIQELQENPNDSNMTKEIKSAICQDLKKRYLDEQRETVCSSGSQI